MYGLDLQIENLRQRLKLSYVDAVVMFAEQQDVEVEDLAKELHSSTKDKLKYEFIKRNMVKGKKNTPSLEKFF